MLVVGFDEDVGDNGEFAIEPSKHVVLYNNACLYKKNCNKYLKYPIVVDLVSDFMSIILLTGRPASLVTSMPIILV
jgi:hypothetical protein